MGRIGKRTKTQKLLLINSYSLGVTTCCLTNKNDVVSEHEALIYSPFKEGVVYMFHSRSHRAQFWWSCTPQHALYKTMSNLHS